MSVREQVPKARGVSGERHMWVEGTSRPNTSPHLDARTRAPACAHKAPRVRAHGPRRAVYTNIFFGILKCKGKYEDGAWDIAMAPSSTVFAFLPMSKMWTQGFQLSAGVKKASCFARWREREHDALSLKLHPSGTAAWAGVPFGRGGRASPERWSPPSETERQISHHCKVP